MNINVKEKVTKVIERLPWRYPLDDSWQPGLAIMLSTKII